MEDGVSNRKLGADTKKLEGNRQERTKNGSLEATLIAEDADRAWDTSRGSASLHATTRHRVGSRRRGLPGEIG